MFGDFRELFQMLDNSGPIARTMAAGYPIVDCEKMSASGLTCNSVRLFFRWQTPDFAGVGGSRLSCGVTAQLCCTGAVGFKCYRQCEWQGAGVAQSAWHLSTRRLKDVSLPSWQGSDTLRILATLEIDFLLLQACAGLCFLRISLCLTTWCAGHQQQHGAARQQRLPRLPRDGI